MKNKKRINFFMKRKGIQGVKPRKKHKITKNNRKIKNYKYSKLQHKIQLLIIFILVITFIVLTYSYIDKQLMPTIMTMSDMKIQTISTQMINKAVQETLDEKKVNADQLVTYYYDNNGDISSIGVNTVLINEICSEVIYKISNDVDIYESTKIAIPIGYFFGGGIFSDIGPDIHINVMPYGTAKINYGREFTSTGINQINHRVWLNVEMTMRVVVPLNSKEVKVSQQVTLVDGVVNGKIPDQYVDVPKEEVPNLID